MWFTNFCLSPFLIFWSHCPEKRAGGYDGYVSCWYFGVLRFDLVVKRFGQFGFRRLVAVSMQVVATASVSAEDGDQCDYCQTHGYDFEICRPGICDGRGDFC